MIAPMENQASGGCVVLGRDGRRGDIWPHFYVGHISSDGHVVFVLRATELDGRRIVGRRLRLNDVVLQRGHRRVGHLRRHVDVRHVHVRLGLRPGPR